MNWIASPRGFLVAAFCCSTLLSCSDPVVYLELTDATLEGKITYAGKPVPYALVIVQGGDQTATANVAKDGTYKVEHVPLGEVKVAVNTEAGRGIMMSDVMAGRQGGGEGPAKFIDLPKKYHDPMTSGITTTITDEKPNQLDIEIK